MANEETQRAQGDIDQLRSELTELQSKIDDMEILLNNASSTIAEQQRLIEKHSNSINAVGVEAEENRNMLMAVIFRQNKLHDTVKQTYRIYRETSNKFESAVTEAIKANKDVIETLARNEQDNKFDESVKALIEQTQKNEIENILKRFEKANPKKPSRASSGGDKSQLRLGIIVGGTLIICVLIGILIMKALMK